MSYLPSLQYIVENTFVLETLSAVDGFTLCLCLPLLISYIHCPSFKCWCSQVSTCGHPLSPSCSFKFSILSGPQLSYTLTDHSQVHTATPSIYPLVTLGCGSPLPNTIRMHHLAS